MSPSSSTSTAGAGAGDDPLMSIAVSADPGPDVLTPARGPDRRSFADLAGPGEPWWRRLRSPGALDAWPPDRSVTRLAAVAVVAAVIGAAAVWAVAGGGSRSPVAASNLPMATRRSAPGTADRPAGTALTPAASPTTVVDGWVAVAGAVVRPGLYRAPADTRVSSLIAAAGGLTAEADADRINLAAAVRDGERVYVPRRGEPGAPPVVAGTGGAGPGAEATSPGAGVRPAPGSRGAPSGPVDLNRATAAELDALPGIGPATASAIIDHRTRSGPFASVEELADVRGIGPAKLEQLRPLVVV